ncbi:MAG: putative DDE transposase [Streblomastix strix]|uniref:Putative DDE transposase n=1 Tax=Streblomastix strix TaxID=222440 RepID=A0A5J4V4F5_9EUKA|nr:MAG: putative DDE transposase [Streblomastix strix]
MDISTYRPDQTAQSVSITGSDAITIIHRLIQDLESDVTNLHIPTLRELLTIILDNHENKDLASKYKLNPLMNKFLGSVEKNEEFTRILTEQSKREKELSEAAEKEKRRRNAEKQLIEEAERRRIALLEDEFRYQHANLEEDIQIKTQKLGEMLNLYKQATKEVYSLKKEVNQLKIENSQQKEQNEELEEDRSTLLQAVNEMQKLVKNNNSSLSKTSSSNASSIKHVKRKTSSERLDIVCLPEEYPKWELVYYYYRKWSGMEEFDLLLGGLRDSVRLKFGQHTRPSLGIMDSQSVRWGNNRSLNGIDGK